MYICYDIVFLITFLIVEKKIYSSKIYSIIVYTYSIYIVYTYSVTLNSCFLFREINLNMSDRKFL